LFRFLGHIKKVPGFNLKTQVCVITFYKEQVACIKEKIKMELSTQDAEDIRVMTVDSFQGSECDCIILSFVRSNNQHNIGFIHDPRRLNVAMTRAKFLLLAVGDTNTLCYGGWRNNYNECPVGELIKFAHEKDIITTTANFATDIGMWCGE
jgi:AAA domain